MRSTGSSVKLLLALLLGAPAGPVLAQTVYKCPGNLYTDSITAKEAAARGCKTLEGAPVTVIQAPARRPAPSDASPRPSDTKVNPGEQAARDTDKRRILEVELKREEDRLTALKAEYNNGQPERRGDEKNYQKYLDRTAELKASLDRSESDVAALRRELSKLGAN